MEHENKCITSSNCCTWYSHQGIGTCTKGLGIERTGGDYSDYSIKKIVLKTSEDHPKNSIIKIS